MNIQLAYDERGLAPTIVQDVGTGEVLMLGYTNEASLSATLETGIMHFWSRSRDALWRKGESSGNTMRVIDMRVDCDNDALLVQVDPAGPACHVGTRTCFDSAAVPERRNAAIGAELARLWDTIVSRAHHRPSGSYTATLLEGGVDACARKVIEEASETVIAAKNHATGAGTTERVVEESADVLYHLMVLLAERNIGLEEVEAELARRAE